MTYSSEPDNRILIFGDLAVDIRTTIPATTQVRSLEQGQDVTVFADYDVRPSGTALLFATAVMEFSAGVPDVVACVGGDLFGSYIEGELHRRKIATAGLQQTHADPTALILVAHRDDGTRLMFQSKATANRWLTVEAVTRYLDNVPSISTSMMWVSGYCLADTSAPRMQAVRAAAEWARKRHIPIAVDLVPHDFLRHVGDHNSVEALIGSVDGLVTELRTVQAFDLPHGTATDAWESLDWYAKMLCKSRDFAIVQHRINSETYGQVAATSMGRVIRLELDLQTNPIHGIGDRMAVLGLKKLRVLPQLRSNYLQGSGVFRECQFLS